MSSIHDGQDIAPDSPPRQLSGPSFRSPTGSHIFAAALPSPRPDHPLPAFALALLLQAACVFAQAPAARPTLANPELDGKLRGMLRYDVPLISSDSLAGLLAASETPVGLAPKPLLLDVREPGEYAVSHLPGAVQVTPGRVPAWLDTVARDRPVVVYCSVGYRSEGFGRDLRDAGFTEVRNLYGSLFDWVDSGHAVVDAGGQPTDAVHTFNERWGKWLTSAEARKVH